MADLEVNKFMDNLRDSNIDIFLLVDEKGYTILHEIILTKIVQRMTVNFIKAFIQVAYDEYGENAHGLLKTYANRETYGDRRTILQLAVSANLTEVIEILVEELGCDLKTVDDQENSLIHIAAKNGHDIMLVKLILTYGLSFVDRNEKGRIPLHLAALEGKPQIIDILLTWMLNPDIPDEDN